MIQKSVGIFRDVRCVSLRVSKIYCIDVVTIRCVTCTCVRACAGLVAELDSAAVKAVNQQSDLRTATTSISQMTIGLICWAVVLTISIAVMTALVTWRMRTLRSRAHRLAAKPPTAYADGGRRLQTGQRSADEVDTEKGTIRGDLQPSVVDVSSNAGVFQRPRNDVIVQAEP